MVKPQVMAARRSISQINFDLGAQLKHNQVSPERRALVI